MYDLTLFLPREDGLYERDEEIHYQKAYDPEKVRELLEKAGLIPLAVYDAYTKDAPKPDSGRLTLWPENMERKFRQTRNKGGNFLYE